MFTMRTTPGQGPNAMACTAQVDPKSCKGQENDCSIDIHFTVR